MSVRGDIVICINEVNYDYNRVCLVGRVFCIHSDDVGLGLRLVVQRLCNSDDTTVWIDSKGNVCTVDEAISHSASITTILINGQYLSYFRSREISLGHRELVVGLVEDWTKLTTVSDVDNGCHFICSHRVTLVGAPDGKDVTRGGLEIKDVVNSDPAVALNGESIGCVALRYAENGGCI